MTVFEESPTVLPVCLGSFGTVRQHGVCYPDVLCGVGAEYISLLFTDLGMLTPAAVSDELIQLYV